MKRDDVGFNDLWERVLNTLYENYLKNDKETFESFFKNTTLKSIKNDCFLVACESKFIAQLLTDNYNDIVLESILRTTDTNYKVLFLSKDEIKNTKTSKEEIESKIISASYFSKIKINPDYTFNNFIEGICNKEARKAALTVATNPGLLYNPLYIQGNSGLGKTHLLNAIANLIKEKDPNMNVLYTSSTNFMEEYINFAKGNSQSLDLPTFIKKYDVLLIDDIQQIANKEKTLDFFFDIYQSFYTAKKQIVITSDRYQNSLEGIPDRLVTRFLQGLTVSINPPDIETSKNILKTKFKIYEETNLTIDDEVLEMIAENYQDSIRSLEGVLVRLYFYANLINKNHIDLDLAEEALANSLSTKKKKKKCDEQSIILKVADYYRVSSSQLTGKVKTAQINNARQIAIYLIRDILDTPYKTIGKLFSNRDHSTIIHACAKVENLVKEDQQIKDLITKFKKELI